MGRRAQPCRHLLELGLPSLGCHVCAGVVCACLWMAKTTCRCCAHAGVWMHAARPPCMHATTHVAPCGPQGREARGRDMMALLAAGSLAGEWPIEVKINENSAGQAGAHETRRTWVCEVVVGSCSARTTTLCCCRDVRRASTPPMGARTMLRCTARSLHALPRALRDWSIMAAVLFKMSLVYNNVN